MSSKIARGLTILVSWRFLLCVLLIMIITAWVPLLSQTYTLQDADGNIFQQQTVKVRVWKSWTRIIHPRASDFFSHLYAVSAHLGICLLVTFLVWYVSPPRSRVTTPETFLQQKEPEDENKSELAADDTEKESISHD